MILVGNQRGGARNLAHHLLKTENEHIDVHELRGFSSDDLHGALDEVYAISRGTKCRQYLYSLSLNPPKDENVGTEAFEDAIDRIEKKLGLEGQARAIVFHEKQGRRHCHAVWSRIDPEAMKAVPLPHTKLKLRDVSRDLYHEHGWQMPRGLMDSRERDPRNFTLAEWQQAQRQGKDPRAIKTAFQDCWAVSDTGAAFASALRERGYILAKGDRRGFVAIDYSGEAYAVSKWSGQKTKDVRERLADIGSLPSVADARTVMAETMGERLRELARQQQAIVSARMAELSKNRDIMIRQHITARRELERKHQQRSIQETKERQARYSRGLRGLLDRVTGRHRKVKKENELAAAQGKQRDAKERDGLIFAQLEARRKLQKRMERLGNYEKERSEMLRHDRQQYKEMQRQKRDKIDRKLDTHKELRGPIRSR